MTKKEAKKYLLRRLSETLLGHLSTGAEYLYDDPEVKTEKDIERVEEMAEELIAEFKRRSA